MNLFDQWETVLPQFPKWCFGGDELELEEKGQDNGYPVYGLIAENVSEDAFNRYIQLLKQNGFAPAAKFPSDTDLFKRVNGVAYNFCGESGLEDGHLFVGFRVREPEGGLK
jgi:hypothetical protein